MIDERLTSPRLVNGRWREWRGELPGGEQGLVCEDDACAAIVRPWLPAEAAWCAAVGGGCVLLPLDVLRMQIQVAAFLHEYRGWFTCIWFGVVRGRLRPPYGPGVEWPCEASAAWRGWSGARAGIGWSGRVESGGCGA